MVLQIPEALGVSSIWVTGVDVCADVWVLQVFAVHLTQVGVLCGPYEAQCAVELFIISNGFCEDVVVGHVVGYVVHGSLGQDKPADGIVVIVRSDGDSL